LLYSLIVVSGFFSGGATTFLSFSFRLRKLSSRY
jgi:hypothetical protein